MDIQGGVLVESQTHAKPITKLSSLNEKNRQAGVWRPFLRLIASVKLPYLWIILCVVVTLTQSTIALLFPQYVQKILAGDISQRTILINIALIFGMGVAASVAQFVGALTSSKISLRFRKFIWRRLIRLPIPYFDRNKPREMISRTTEDTTRLSNFFAVDLGGIISSIYLLIGTFVILFSYNWRLAAVEAVIIPLVIVVGIVNGRLSYKWTNRVQRSLAKLTELLSELLVNIPLIKTFTKENVEEERGKEYIDKLYLAKLMFTFITKLIRLLNEMINVLQTIIVIVLGIYLVSKNIITLPVWIAFYLYAQSLTSAVAGIMDSWANLKTCQGAVRRLSEITMEPLEAYENISQRMKPNDELSFDQVTFKYADHTVLRNVTFSIPSGKTTAIIGPSGAGKSTIFNLIERFYRADEGKIRLGAISIDEYNLQEWRNSIGCVSQETRLFSGTLRENITYGLDRSVSDEEIIDAAKEAFAWEFISSFEHGLDTDVGEAGSKLSGGQRQRIAIARVILKNPGLLLLDEATSNLDAETEAMVNQALKKLSSGRTTIIIAHRLSTIEAADQIILLGDEHVKDVGNHTSLLQRNPLYKQMIDIQKSV
ncbi:ABC transporter ATP-binding protein [Paenibacillus pabuli]|uniref:ABC transporter ATP-binding protein n=1 Tax=Paenibacillus pabuli TaxID=1472 RepID=UPI001FFF5A30|nr:ABC transporter ATP-binding protein [Paenibacillus pabuli]UPK41113.1 ABC transporter ATP-binding protein [Paenibacillus pabuli]